MRFQSILAASLVSITVVSGVQAQVIEIRPKSPVNESPNAPVPRPSPRIPIPAPESSESPSLQTLIEVDILSPGILGDPSAQT